MKLKDYIEATATRVADFAEAISVTTPTIYRWINGTRHPNRSQMLAIFRATRGAVTPNDLVLEGAQ